jgi:hypothetical protein
MPWAVRAVQLPDGDRPVDLWVDAAGCLVGEPVPGAERLPGRYVVPGWLAAMLGGCRGGSAASRGCSGMQATRWERFAAGE